MNRITNPCIIEAEYWIVLSEFVSYHSILRIVRLSIQNGMVSTIATMVQGC